jgi:integrating conjugative element protein (TIGR03765 family)|tara:strand:+ start:23564 stop:24010 length:447 start_codon:yes stop_codon:yes gene_type:complete
VIAVIGETIPTESYYELIDVEQARQSFSLNLNNYRENFTEEAFFPLSTSMSPGQLDSREFREKQPRVTPFVVIGQDELSEKWLTYRYDELVKMKAVVFVVEASSFEFIRGLSSRFSPLKFAPAKGDAIGEALNVQTYPFMVNQNGVWQ